MKKKFLFILIPAVVILAVWAALQGLAPIITGYAAKNLASDVFLGKRTQKSVEKEDLNFSFIRFNKNTIDRKRKEVTSRFLFWESKAIYIEGFGCTLVRDFTEEEIRKRPYKMVPLPEMDPDTVCWPMGDLLADTLPQTVNLDKMNAFLDQVFADTLPMKGTFAVAVAHQNQLITERYRDDFSADNRFLSWSMAKSFINTFAGILVAQGKMDLNEPAAISEWKDDERSRITLANLLQMNSGLTWNEDYGSDSDVNRMLFKRGDMAAFAVAMPLEADQPGTEWKYSSGTTNIASRLVREAVGNDAEYYAFPREELFNKIGMRTAIFETDAAGCFVGSSYLYASMRDYLRYGLLYLNDGNWLGEQLLPEGWVDFTRETAQGSEGKYGAFFWLNRDGKYPDVPADMYRCDGYNGQYIFIIPSKELVVVRTGYSPRGWFDVNLFLKGILEAIE